MQLVYQARPSLTLQKSEGERQSGLIDYYAIYNEIIESELYRKVVMLLETLKKNEGGGG